MNKVFERALDAVSDIGDGASTFFGPALSFGMIRGGHIDAAILGAMQVMPVPVSPGDSSLLRSSFIG